MKKRFSEHLRQSCADDWRKAHETHPFVIAMGDGSLSLDRFSYFMRQDYLFLIDYCRVVSLACAKCPDLKSMGWWARLLDETLNSEMALHRSFCADFGITEADLEATEPGPATVAYTTHLLRTAYEDTIGLIATALLPCQWGYDEIGQQLGAIAERAARFVSRPVGRRLQRPRVQGVDRMAAGIRRPAGQRGKRSRTGAHGDRIPRQHRYEYLFWEAAWRLQNWPDQTG